MHKKDARTMSLYELLFGLCIVGIMLSVEVTGYILRYHVGIWFSYYLLTIYRWLPPTWTHQRMASARHVSRAGGARAHSGRPAHAAAGAVAGR